jgi:hypothetical protein
MDAGVNMTEIILDHRDQLWAQLQLIQSKVVDQIFLGDTSQDWVAADQWLSRELGELEPSQYVVFTSSNDSSPDSWADPDYVWLMFVRHATIPI